MDEPDAELAELFRDEAGQRLNAMDDALLAIESGRAGAEVIGSLFRNAHTIKGGAALLGYEDIRALAHAAEDVLEVLRQQSRFPPGLAAPLLQATGTLRTQVGGGDEAGTDLLDELARMKDGLLGAEAGGRGQDAPRGEPDGAGASPPEPGDGGPPREAGRPDGGEPDARQPGDGTRPAPGPPPETGPPRPAVPSGQDQDQGERDEAGRQDGAGRAEAGREQGGARPGPAGRRALRVPAGKIDQLIDVVGEVVQDRRRLAHTLVTDLNLSADVTEELMPGDRMLEELKDTAAGLRTLPFSSITGPLPRAVRDMARSAGKDVELTVTGAGTELDRVVLESLSEPLTHLLRNAVTHGIESPDERERAGKPRRGHIALKAEPRGGLVEVIISDDGKGVSQAVMERASREGSLADVLTQPGYSTAPRVTDLAGRGVGLDAVKAYVQSLGGGIDVRSQPGRGTQFVLLLPLTLALLQVLLCERGGAVYGVPLAAVDEVVTVTEPLSLQGRQGLDLRGRLVQLADLAALAGDRAAALPGRPPALVISASGRQIAAACDRLLGAEEVVVKPLGPLLAGIGGYLGAAILGDGRIALLIEPASLTRGWRQDAAAGEAPEGPRPQPRILVVEDSFTVRELQRSILEAAGYPVVTARDGRDALAVLGRDPEISLVVTDIEMPGLDGLELTRAIRAEPARSSLPVVVVTARGGDDDQRRGIEAGADAYMTKPGFDQHALLATVERLVGR